MSADAFLRAMMRDVAWGFFYGWVNFDAVFGTRNLYGRVDLFAGRYNEAIHKAGLSLRRDVRLAGRHGEVQGDPGRLDQRGLRSVRRAGGDRAAAAFGEKHGDNLAAIERFRVATKRMPGLEGDSPLRGDDNGFPVNRAFADVARTSRRSRPSPASRRSCTPSTCSSTCRART